MKAGRMTKGKKKIFFFVKRMKKIFSRFPFFPFPNYDFSSSVTLVLPDIGAFSSLVVGTFVLVPSLALLLHLTDVLTLVLDNAVPGPLPPRGANLGTGGLTGQHRRQQGYHW